jgi:glyceraldehyde-3-phosphate dehydrogenase/erythrose-4-phosphate dehydrogenase
MVRKFNIIQFVIQKNYLENNIDVVIESTGFTASEDAKNILKQGPNR